MRVIEIAAKSYKPATDAQKAEVQEKIKKMRKEGEKLVRGIFEFVDAQGGWIDFSYRFFQGPIMTVHIEHGEEIEVPIILAKHLNNVYKKVRMPSGELDESGRPLKAASMTRISRTRFTPVDIM